MAKKVSLDTLKKRAARLKIKGRSAMNKAQLQAACDACTPKKQTRRKPAMKPRQRSTQYGGRPINRRRTMGEYQGWMSYNAWWLSLEMNNNQGLYNYFKELIDEGVINDGRDLRDEWFHLLENEIDAYDCSEIVKDMANAFLYGMNEAEFREVYEGFVEE